MQSTINRYNSISIFLHWTIALIVLPMVLGSFYLSDISDLYRGTAVGFHKSFGLLVLMLMVLRILVIKFYGRPGLPHELPCWQKMLARGVQYGFYLVLVAMPMFGWIMSTAAGKAPYFFGLGPIPFPGIEANKDLSDLMFTFHQSTAYIIIGLITLHILGALKHYYINRDDVVQKMLPRCCKK